jgi:hypothetical protein
MLSSPGTNSREDFWGRGSADMPRNMVSAVIEAPMPTPMAAIISTVSATWRLRLRSPSPT